MARKQIRPVTDMSTVFKYREFPRGRILGCWGNFETVCGMAGVTPSKARSFAYKVIRADNKKFLRNRIRSVLRGDNEKENDV